MNHKIAPIRRERSAGAGERCVVVYTGAQSERNWLLTLLLCVFFGWLGLHRFYVGKVGTGLIQFFTVVGFGVWWFVDLLLILFGEFRDAQGLRVRSR